LTIVTTLAVACGHGLLCVTKTLALSLAQHDPPFVMFQLPRAFQKATYFFQEQTATQQSVDRLRWLHSLRLLCRRHTLKKLAPDRNLHEKLLTQVHHSFSAQQQLAGQSHCYIKQFLENT